MPVEIKELNIKITVSKMPDESLSGISEAAYPAIDPTPAMIEACVEKVLKILKSKVER